MCGRSVVEEARLSVGDDVEESFRAVIGGGRSKEGCVDVEVAPKESRLTVG